MKKALLLATIVMSILVTTNMVMAFGGHGGGHKSAAYNSGVDAIGVHYSAGPKTLSKKCPAHSKNVEGLCQCVEGYISDLEGGCIENPCEQAGVRPAKDGSCTICMNGNVYLSYMDDPCAIPTDFDGCKSNDDCDEGEYCQLTGEWRNECAVMTGGICTAIGDYANATVEGLGHVRHSDDVMSWWAAENWCHAQGKRLVPIEEFQCYVSGTSTRYTENIAQTGGCCVGEGATCAYNANWYTDGQKANFSPVLYALSEVFGHAKYFWTSSNYSPNGFCGAFIVHLYNGLTNSHWRNGTAVNATGVRALCACPKGYDGANCDVCAEGYAGDNCNTCAPGYEEFNNKCVPTCDIHEIYNSSTGVCECESGYELFNEICMPTCTDGQVHNYKTGICEEPCPKIPFTIWRSARDGSCSVCANGRLYLTYSDTGDASGVNLPGCQYLPTNFQGCKHNDDCANDEFCEFVDTGVCQYPTQSSCSPVGDYVETYVPELGQIRMSMAQMTQWAALNWCTAQGMTLLSVEDMGCYYSGTNTLISHLLPDSVPICCAAGKSCSDWHTLWVDNDIDETIVSNYSPVLVALRRLRSDSYVWTSTNVLSRDGGAVCHGLKFSLSGAGRGWHSHQTAGYAVCR